MIDDSRFTIRRLAASVRRPGVAELVDARQGPIGFVPFRCCGRFCGRGFEGVFGTF
jgi:hypothetical protein